MEKEIFDIKHEMLTMQSEIDKAKEKIKELSDEELEELVSFSENDIFLN